MVLNTNISYKLLKIIFLFIFFSLAGCSSTRLAKFSPKLNTELLSNSFYGGVVVDANTGRTIYKTNGDKYFTPASNVKIFTLYTAICLLPNRIPTLKYASSEDTLYIEGTGDPSWLHPILKDSTALKFLAGFENINLHLQNSIEPRYGPGWAWEDFDTYFSPEKNSLPIHGNVVTVYQGDSLQVYPEAFQNRISFENNGTRRDEFENRFYVSPKYPDTTMIPFRTSEKLTQKLLSSALKKKVRLINQFPNESKKALYGIETDSIYKLMMHESDNFLAEQLLLASSSMLSDTLGTKQAIDYILNNDLADLRDLPRWVDGSGLSRYNLFTPESMIQVLQKLHAEISEERLFTLFPLWDASGTVEAWEYSQAPPFIYAKSGSLGNNYNLSGFVKTKSGKVLIFSIMHNHFRVPSSEIRNKIFELLLQLHHRY